MTRYWFRGGPGDPVMLDVPGSPPSTVKRPHPEDMSAAMSQGPVGDETPPVLAYMRHTAYYCVRVSDGNSESRIEYWTAEKKAADLATQRPATLEQRVRELELQVQTAARTEELLVKGFADLSQAITALREALMSSSSVEGVATELESRLGW